MYKYVFSARGGGREEAEPDPIPIIFVERIEKPFGPARRTQLTKDKRFRRFGSESCTQGVCFKRTVVDRLTII